jgi:hypothetical protein
MCAEETDLSYLQMPVMRVTDLQPNEAQIPPTPFAEHQLIQY